MPKIIETEWYVADVSSLKDRFPEYQWTADYMSEVLGMINASINNHSLEETIRYLNPEPYTNLLTTEILVIHTSNRLKNVYMYHRLHMWDSYEEV